jgi:hypothetical protein
LVYDGEMKLFAVLVISLFAACGGDADCADLCTEAQAGDCTSVVGNCGSFCAALDGVQGDANCVSQRTAYESCLNEGDSVCVNDCDSEETALSNCIAAFCINNQSDPDCITLAGSF